MNSILALRDKGITVELPAEWGASIDYDSWPRREATETTFLHWGGTKVRDSANAGHVSGERATLRGWEEYHVDSKGWDGLAYDLAIGQSGRVYIVRGDARSAATSGDMDRDGIPNNLEGDAVVCLLGQGQTPSDAMLDTLRHVCEALGRTVVPHADAGGTKTSCPGPELTEFTAKLNASTVSAPPRADDKVEQPSPSSPEAAAAASTSPKVARPSRPSGNIVLTIEVSEVQIRSVGPDVARAQAHLRRHGVSTGKAVKVDGKFGIRTEKALRQFQSHRGLTVDGIAGPITWKELVA